MDEQELKFGRQRRSMYVAVSNEVRVAAKQRALAVGRTLSEVVEDALRAALNLPKDGAEDDQA